VSAAVDSSDVSRWFGEEQVVATLQQQVDGMLTAGYARTEIVASEVTVFNATSALYRGTFTAPDGAARTAERRRAGT
jgi:hypothetical protein